MASAVSAMRVSMLLKDAPTATSKQKTYALGVNRSYSKHFAVLDFSVDATSM